jgi:hydrogenase maturation protein HypF
LRRRKRRFGKPFALMARDIDVIGRYAAVSDVERAILASAEAPIVLLDANGPERLPETVAPGLALLGFMLPHSPLHHLILRDFDQPLVMTSGNLSDEPPCVADLDARSRLAGVADNFLIHDRQIVNRVDDSVARVVAGAPVLIRRSRGYAPMPINLPDGFAAGVDVLAMGGELKNTFCLVREGHAILSQHQGDLEDAATFADFEKNLALFTRLFDHDPIAIAVDKHPDYLATKYGRMLASKRGLPAIDVQHHHAHIAACLADNGVPLDSGRVLGIALDGLGFGDDGTMWGGELLLADYRGYERLACLKAVPMPGGTQAVREPWRNLYAHLDSAMGYDTFRTEFRSTRLADYLDRKPTATLAAMIAKGLNSPLASSCGRLFDAVGAALGVCADAISYEGEAAAQLEALFAGHDLGRTADPEAYRFTVRGRSGSVCGSIDPAPMWWDLCRDLRDGVSPQEIALRFHLGLARAIADMTAALISHVEGLECDTIALSGGCFQNRYLTEEIVNCLQFKGLRVLMHRRVPANDGGLALGQAAISVARLMRT